MERRSLTHETIELRADEGKPKRITGYGARYYDGTEATEYVLWDDTYGKAVERIMPGTFDRAVREDDVRGMYNHSQILARTKSGTMRLSLDERGLLYDIDVPNTTVGRDVTTSIERGDVDGSSFAFTIPSGGQEWRVTTDADGKEYSIREISEVILYDTGPVDFPAYESTTAGLRACGGVEEARAALAVHKKRCDTDAKAQRDQAAARVRCLEVAGE